MAQISPVPLETDAALTRLTFVVSKESALSLAGRISHSQVGSTALPASGAKMLDLGHDRREARRDPPIHCRD
ncbi:unnamed protein product [Parascedosporium putredinis]|uniref:Uncharacterized protein n=1 Tax=Parascedosporium putredinis TaxID=1442378 RepID=A0A9P1ME58_9PEZI|nr:unnamed protein product [Parascedosporium putredinis]CAI8003994.1 unnamed protein product [Parascedosporium putredinis]